MNNNALEIKDLTVNLGTFSLNNLNLKMPKGMILGIVGKNGAGKTTLIKTIANIYKPASGIITLNGHTIYESQDSYLKEIGIVPSNNWINQYVNIKRLIKIIKKSYPNFNETFFYQSLEKLEVPIDKRSGKLSKGMQKKLGLIIIMSLNPNILILDEPTAEIDPISKREILNLLQSYIEDEQKTIIYSTHQTDELDKVADYILGIDNGNVIFFSDKETLLTEHRIINLTKDEFNKVNNTDIIGLVKRNNDYSILTKNIDLITDFDVTRVTPSIEDIIYYYMQGVKK